MSNQTDETNGVITHIDTNKWMKTIRELSQNTLCEKEVEPILSTLEKNCRDNVKIAFIGTPNSGKSSIINKILERKILPVTTLSSPIEFEIRAVVTDQSESFSVGGVSKPLDELKETVAILTEHKKFDSFVLTIHSDWLNSRSFVIIEKPPLDYTDTLEEVIDEYLRGSDLVIFIIDAPMPVKKTEAIFIKECAAREIPIIVVLSKMDEITAEERYSVISYVTKHMELYSPSIPVLEIQANSDDSEANGINKLRTLIESVVKTVDLCQVHNRQLAQTLLKSMEPIKINAHLALDMEKRNEEERKCELVRLREEIDSQNLVWAQIEQKLTESRQKAEEKVRKHLEAQSDTILKTLLNELDNKNDIQMWWSRDMPLHLQRELQSSAYQISPVVNQQVAADIKWLQTELSQRFKFDFEILTEPQITVNGDSSKQKDLFFSDNSKFKIITKFGTIATVVIIGTMLVTSSLGGFILAASAATGLVAEQLIRSNTSKDKEKVRDELKNIVTQATKEYLTAFSQSLRDEYQKLSASLKAYNLKWQQAQLEALKIEEHRDKHGNEINYNVILQKINTLSNEIIAKCMFEKRVE